MKKIHYHRCCNCGNCITIHCKFKCKKEINYLIQNKEKHFCNSNCYSKFLIDWGIEDGRAFTYM